MHWAVSIAVPALAGFVGVLIGAWLAARREVSQRYAFIEKQLRDFYSPLVGICNEILTKSELRVKLHSVANAVWQSPIAEKRTLNNPDRLLQFERERWPVFERARSYLSAKNAHKTRTIAIEKQQGLRGAFSEVFSRYLFKQ